jgi:hypothetical protein
MKPLTELKLSKYDDALYIIAYVKDDMAEVGVDYTSNMAELLNLLDYHAKNSNSYEVIKINKGE